MQPLIFAKDAFGLPTSDLLADLSGRMADVEYAHSSMWGPLEARVEWAGTLDEGFDAADRFLGCPLEIIGPDGAWCWEGIVWTVSFGAGQRRRTRTLEGYAERGFVFYTELNDITGDPIAGPPRTAIVGASTSTSTRPHFIQNIGGPYLPEVAERLAAMELARRSTIRWLPETGGAYPASERTGPIVTLEALGWYRTLWYVPIGPGTTQQYSVKLIISDILDDVAPFLSSDRSMMNVQTQQTTAIYETREFPGEVIKRLLPHGVLAGDELIFGLLPGRVPYLRLSKRFSTEPDYIERIDGALTVPGGGDVPPWLVRPDTILRQADFVPTSTSKAAEIDTLESIYLTETRYQSATNSLTYTAAVAGVLGEVEVI